MRTVRVPDVVFNGVREVADREGISMASVLDRMLTYPCSVCGQPCIPDSEKEFRLFSTSKATGFKGWSHASCGEKK